MVGWRYQTDPREPIDYLRGVLRRKQPPAPAEPAPAPPAAPLPPISWANPVRTAGACTCDVIYSDCRCAATSISAETSTADFPADQQ